MSAIAETPFDSAAGDRLAKRNALVLAVGQALAGANNTVIVATGSILGSMMAPDKSLATLPISVMVCGIWAGTLAARLSRQALRPAHRVRERCRRGHGRGPDRLHGDPAGELLALSGGDVLRRALCGLAHVLPLRRHRHRERGVQAEGRGVGDGGRTVRRDPRAAARDLHQGSDAAASVCLELYRAGRLRAHRRHHHRDVLPRAGPRTFRQHQARPPDRARSAASRNSSSRWCAASPATR